MPFSIVRNDIARVRADALVNAANTRLAEGGGVCGAIFAAAGREQMRAACAELGGCPTGGAVVTPAFNLPARWCIHAVGPIWHGGNGGEEEALRSCFRAIFARVVELGAASVAYPLISAGIYGYPTERALAVAREETRAFLAEHDDVQVTLVVFERSTVQLSYELDRGIREYIDDAYVAQSPRTRRGGEERAREERWAEEDANCAAPASALPPSLFAAPTGQRPQAPSAPTAPTAPMAPGASAPARPGPHAPAAPSMAGRAARPEAATGLDEALAHLDASFTETLFALIDERGLTDAEVYRRANLSRQLFSKIRSKPGYRPTKLTAVALAMALELDLPTTQDLLARAGLALSPANIFDVIVKFFIEHRIYDIYQLNEALFTYDQPLVGSF